METLTEVEIKQVWDRFCQHHDTESRNTLLEFYLPQVKYTAQRLCSRYPKSVELEDLYSAGILGLIDALNKYEPNRNVKFETYCVRRIHGSILDDLRKKDYLPRLVRERAQQLQRATQKLESIFGRVPSDLELADEMHMSMEQFYHFQRDANASVLFSLNTSRTDSGEDGEFSELHMAADQKSVDPFLEIQKRDLKEFVARGFSREEKLVIFLYYYEELTMKEIGNTLGITESRVSQVHSSIISRLKAQLDEASLLMY